VFPSSRGETPHVTRDTIRNRFQKLAADADLPERIEGERPSPQLCRRFWYDTYTAVLEGVLEGVEEIAAEQGSSDPQVVMQNYLSDSRSRHLRREFMREQLVEIFRSEEGISSRP
jgi:integrase